jgi:hypothetical protein
MDGHCYRLEFGAAMVCYAVLLVVSLRLIRHGVVAGDAAAAVALLPMLAGVGVCWAVLRQLRRMDELQRRLQLEALALAFAGTALITFSYGFLENIGFPCVSMFAVWPLMGTLWIAGLLFCRRRYA